MRKVKLTTDYGAYKQGRVYQLDNNEAWALVENYKVAIYIKTKELKQERQKVMLPGRSKLYRTK